MKQSTKEKGDEAESRAARYLESRGYTIVDRNWRCRSGEIDIIAGCGEFLVFVEVKSLPNGSIDMLSHELNRTKQKKIIKTSKFYLQNNRQYSSKFIRYDVLALDVPDLESIYHIEGAFSE